MDFMIHGTGKIGGAFIEASIKHREDNGFPYNVYTHDINKEAGKYKPDFTSENFFEIEYLDSLIHIICIDTNLNTNKEEYFYDKKWNSTSYKIVDLVKKITDLRGFDNRNADIVVIESTIEPGTMKVLNELFPDWDFVYSPERYNEDKLLTAGFSMDPMKLISFKPNETEAYYDNLNSDLQFFYQIHFANGIKVFIDGTYQEVELAKIIENAKRLVEIQFINEMNSEVNKKYPEVNFETVVSLVNSKTHTNVRPGLIGGGCIPVDPLFMDSDSKILVGAGNSAVIQANEIKSKIVDISKRSNIKTILMMGTTFKANSTSESYSRYKNILTNLVKELPEIRFGTLDHRVKEAFDFGSEESRETIIQVLKSADLILIGANHTISEIGKTYLEFAMEHGVNVIDLNTFRIFKNYGEK